MLQTCVVGLRENSKSKLQTCYLGHFGGTTVIGIGEKDEFNMRVLGKILPGSYLKKKTFIVACFASD